MLRMFQLWLQTTGKTLTLPRPKGGSETRLHSNPKEMLEFRRGARKALTRSLLVRHLDVGSNNAEEAELVALGGPLYDLAQYGVDFTASPRHADVLAVTGPVTRQLKVALERTYAATPNPKLVMAIGDGACYGSAYETSYACLGPVDQFISVDIYVPGDPPSPRELIQAFLTCKQLLAERN
ncbi:MAG TPA: hypothetical protein V6C52_08620 [Coleofasciculaceae cyanobacterium]